MERWAELFENRDVTRFLFKSCVIEPLNGVVSSYHITGAVGYAVSIVFAADLLEGHGHIVRISDDIYDDVLNSHLDEEVRPDHRIPHMPWDIFAVEVKDSQRQQAKVAANMRYVMYRIPSVLQRFGLEQFTEVYMDALNQIIHMMTNDTDLSETQKFEIPMLVAIPTFEYMEEQAKAMLDVFILTEDTPESRQNGRKLTPLMRYNLHRIIDKVPIDFDWTRQENLERFRKPKHTDNLIMFTWAENTTRRTTYAPDPKLKPNPKKKRGKATIHEVGFQWTDAYRAYRSATKSDKLGGHVREHVRRGHWHRFRTGPRDAAKPTYVTYWLPPMLVGSHGESVNTGHVIR